MFFNSCKTRGLQFRKFCCRTRTRICNKSCFIGSITNGIVSSKIYDKRDDSNFEIVNLPSLDGDISCSHSYGLNISQLIPFVSVSSNVCDFNNRNRLFTTKLLKRGYRSNKSCKAFSKFYHRHTDSIGLQTFQ